jgi:hypothetical protein
VNTLPFVKKAPTLCLNAAISRWFDAFLSISVSSGVCSAISFARPGVNQDSSFHFLVSSVRLDPSGGPPTANPGTYSVLSVRLVWAAMVDKFAGCEGGTQCKLNYGCGLAPFTLWMERLTFGTYESEGLDD